MHNKTSLLLWSWWCKSCELWRRLWVQYSHTPTAAWLCHLAPAYHPPPSLPPLPFPLLQLREPHSRSLVIFLTRASCLATVSHAIDTNYTRPDPCNGALCTAPGVMYQYPANCCQVSHSAPYWHSVMCQVSADNQNQNKWLHHMLCIFQMQLKTNNLNVEPGLQPRRKFWVWCFLMSLN